MARYKLGLIASIIIGILIAFFPLYADALSGRLWHYSSTATSATGERPSERISEIEGRVDAVYAEESTIVVSGVSIRVTGTWLGPDGKELDAEDLLSLLQPGEEVRATYTLRGRWGAFLEEITILPLGETYKRVSEGGG